MYFWGGVLFNFDIDVWLIVIDIVGNVIDYIFVQVGFGGVFLEVSVLLSGELVLVEDEVVFVIDVCEDLVNVVVLEGKIVIIDCGNCEFGFKVFSVENVGVIGVIICNNVVGDFIIMGVGVVGDQVIIFFVMIIQGDCVILKILLFGVMIIFFVFEFQVFNLGFFGLSSDLDNGVIVYEYIYGIFICFIGGVGNSGCLGNFEQAGEGWSDWYVLVMIMIFENMVDQVWGIGIYVVNEFINGGGIRIYFYICNMNVNFYIYLDINGEFVLYGVGLVWCVMIWDMYWNLVDEYGFDDNFYIGIGGNNIVMQLVIDGLKLQFCGFIFLDVCDVILEVDMFNYDGVN